VQRDGTETKSSSTGIAKVGQAAGKRLLSLGAVAALACGLAPKADAFIIVIKPPPPTLSNYYLKQIRNNTGSTASAAWDIDYQMRRVNWYARGIYGYAGRIDNSTTKIDASTHNIDNTTTTTLNQQTNYYNVNYAICGGGAGTLPSSAGTNTWNTSSNDLTRNDDGDFYCTVVNQGEEDTAAANATSKALGDTQNLVGHFSDAKGYANGNAIDAADAGSKGSEAQKTANTALVQTLQDQSKSVATDAERLSKTYDASLKAHGQAIQLQYLNALASEQAHQLVQMRSVMLASQQAEVTRNQVIANREAQAIAAGAKLRKVADTSSIKDASTQSW
jgi:hypothetical protein